mgnify:FL=1
MKKLLTVAVMISLVLGIGSVAFAQTGEVSADLWFVNHVYEEPGDKWEASGRLTAVTGTFDITNKFSVAGSGAFGKTDKFEKAPAGRPEESGELTNLNVAVQYQVIPMVKAQAGFFTGGYKLHKNLEEYSISGITIGVAVDFEVGDGIGIYGEANYAPIASAKLKEADMTLDGSSMMAFEAGGKYDFGQFAVKAGYRYKGLEFKKKDAKDAATASFSGFFVGGGIKF